MLIDGTLFTQIYTCPRTQLAPMRLSITARSLSSDSRGGYHQLVASRTAKRILTTLESLNSPLSDARKLPMRALPGEHQVYTYTCMNSQTSHSECVFDNFPLVCVCAQYYQCGVCFCVVSDACSHVCMHTLCRHQSVDVCLTFPRLVLEFSPLPPSHPSTHQRTLLVDPDQTTTHRSSPMRRQHVHVPSRSVCVGHFVVYKMACIIRLLLCTLYIDAGLYSNLCRVHCRSS